MGDLWLFCFSVWKIVNEKMSNWVESVACELRREKAIESQRNVLSETFQWFLVWMFYETLRCSGENSSWKFEHQLGGIGGGSKKWACSDEEYRPDVKRFVAFILYLCFGKHWKCFRETDRYVLKALISKDLCFYRVWGCLIVAKQE